MPHKFKVNLPTARVATLIVVFSVLSFSLGFLIRDNGYSANVKEFPTVNINRELPQDKEDLDFNLFWQVWNSIETSYYDKSKLDDAQMVFGAIRGMVAAVGDPYTVFLSPNENKMTQEDLQGNFEGVGIQIGFKGTQLAVIAPLKGSPAEEAGIKPGDIIAGIRDKNKDIERGTAGITLPEAVQIIRGEAGTSITLSLLREGNDNPIIVDVVRKKIDVPSVVLSFVGENKNVAHLQVLKFGGETLDEWNNAVLDILKTDDLAGIIVDVRNNPGGYLQGAIDLGSDFLENGDVVVVEEDGNGKQNELRVERIGRLTKDKVVVLINEGSASASEIFAGALRDNNKTQLIGEKSFGKGTIQDAKNLENGTGLHLTIAKWLTPNGTWVHDKGLSPDLEVKDDPETSKDEQLDRAIEYLGQSSATAGI